MKLSTLFIVLISYNHKLYFIHNGIGTQTVKVKPATSFTIKKDGRISWAKYKIGNGEVTFSTTANTTTNNRSCEFVLIDKNGNPVDTLEVIQAGQVSATAVKNVIKVVGSASSTKSKTTTSKTTTTRRSTTSSSKSSYGGQCAAKTKKGSRCSRQASAGSIYCWQHNK